MTASMASFKYTAACIWKVLYKILFHQLFRFLSWLKTISKTIHHFVNIILESITIFLGWLSTLSSWHLLIIDDHLIVILEIYVEIIANVWFVISFLSVGMITLYIFTSFAIWVSIEILVFTYIRWAFEFFDWFSIALFLFLFLSCFINHIIIFRFIFIISFPWL